jgi:Flp pilus assembly pilin Flp
MFLLLKDRRGITALEYALVGLMVFMACVAGIRQYALSVNTMYETISSTLT